MHDLRLANLLGAAVLAVDGLMLEEVRRAGAVGVSGAGALVVLSASPGIGVTELGRRVGTSQSAAARMVDSLAAEGLVRRSSRSGRSVRVELTAAGHAAVERILSARARLLRRLLEDFDVGERASLAALLTKLLGRIYGEVGNSELLCRLCDRDCCTDSAVCPVGQAERERLG